jgi:hypothetical protein
MWFSGLRGAIAYALALHLEFEEEKRRVVVTTTLIIVLFTIIILGGFTMPVMKVRTFLLSIRINTNFSFYFYSVYESRKESQTKRWQKKCKTCNNFEQNQRNGYLKFTIILKYRKLVINYSII